MKKYWESGGIGPCILNLGTRCKRLVRFTPRPLYSRGKGRRYPLDRSLIRPWNWSGRGGDEEKSHHSTCQKLKSGHSARSLVSILTELPRLQFVLCRLFKRWNTFLWGWDGRVIWHAWV